MYTMGNLLFICLIQAFVTFIVCMVCIHSGKTRGKGQ